MTFGFGVQGKAEENQIIEVAGTFSLEKLRKEVDGVGWMVWGGWEEALAD